ncbi:hypothetical protein Tco_1086850 [Tanacetum coccineum]
MSVEESDESNGGPTNRLTERRRPSVVSEKEQLSGDTKKTIKAIKEARRIQETQVKELVLHQRFLMTQQANLQPQVKELGSEYDSHQSDDEHVNEDEVTWVSTNDEEKANEDDDDRMSIIKDHADTEIKSLLDIPIQQEIPSALSAPLLDVLVSVTPPPTTTTPTPTPLQAPPITSEAPPVISTVPDLLPAVIQRLTNLESKFKA